MTMCHFSTSVGARVTGGATAATVTEDTLGVEADGATLVATVATQAGDSTEERAAMDTDSGSLAALLANKVLQRTIGLPRFARAAARR